MSFSVTFLCAGLSFLCALPATARIDLSVTFSNIQALGQDPNGFDGSIWTFVYSSPNTTYAEIQTLPAIVTDNSTLTVTGATTTAYNSTFSITESGTTDFGLFPNASGSAYFPLTTGGAFAAFSFGTPTLLVTPITAQGSSLASPSLGDTVEASHWDGLQVGASAVDVGGNIYNFGVGTVTVVPEPATAGLILLGGILVTRAWKRRFLS